MKHSAVYILLFYFVALFLGLPITACKKNDPGNGKTNNSKDDPADPNKVSAHLQFFDAVTKKGNPPAAPAQSTLKISFKDTLYLLDDEKMSIEFLHNKQTNVAGVYIQVKGNFLGGTGGIFQASDYYDVPEIEQTADSDSVSIVLAGFDPEGFDPSQFQLPFSFPIDIIPYDSNRNPLDKTTVVVTVEEENENPGNGGACGFINPPGTYWRWAYSYTQDQAGQLDRFFSPFDEFKGQNISGCCDSVTGKSCGPGQAPNKTLVFPTLYVMAFELIVLKQGGSFERETIELHQDPIRDSTNFCGSGPGLVTELRSEMASTTGDWAYNAANKILQLRGTSGTAGWGNAGGGVQVGCRTLLLINTLGEPLRKNYRLVRPNEDSWHNMD
jgi:hypothetical protein